MKSQYTLREKRSFGFNQFLISSLIWCSGGPAGSKSGKLDLFKRKLLIINWLFTVFWDISLITIMHNGVIGYMIN